jgi:hypothetical protein
MELVSWHGDLVDLELLITLVLASAAAISAVKEDAVHVVLAAAAVDSLAAVVES